MKSLLPTTIVLHKPQPDDRYYYTSNLYLAAYLSLKQLPLVNIETSARTTVYTFHDTPEREEWEESFKHGPADVNAREFALTIHDMQRLMKQTKLIENQPIDA